jgi:hypothetical protein
MTKWLTGLEETKLKIFARRRNVIEWKFKPHTPHMGGAWERLIRTVKISSKTILEDIIKDRSW